MAVDKKIQPIPDFKPIQEPNPEAEILIEDARREANADDIDVIQEDDGGATVDFDPNRAPITGDFYQNLAEVLSDDDLNGIASDLVGEFKADRDSRSDWEDSYTKGLDLLGFKYDERRQPFQGASGVTHPLLAESVTQFQAQAFKEMLPPQGPVKTTILGMETPETIAQADRVQDFMNYQITTVMEDYTPDMDQLLFHLPLAGSAFKKVYYDGTKAQCVSKFVPAEDLVVNYLATDLDTAERVGQIVKMTRNELLKLQVNGFYRDIEVEESNEESKIQGKYNTLEGVEKTDYSNNTYTLYEIHCNLNIKGFEDKDGNTGEETGIELPYIVTIDEGSNKILSIYRNYKEDDPLKKKIQYFVHYKFLPGLGFYGFGLIHMLGGLSRTATSTLRQLIDAGTLSNLPAGFKARGLRIRDDDNPLQPGEFRDVDAPSGDLRQGLLPLPYKGPDQTLFQLLSFCVDAGKRFAAVADMKIAETNTNAPVGTTLALMEQGAKVMSAIHKRLHYAQKIEFKLLAQLFSTSLPPEYPYQVVGGNQTVKQTDFDDRIDVVPVSDPNMFSMSQRVAMAQLQLQLAQSNPEQHNMQEAYRRMYLALGVDNIEALLPPPPQPQPTDPALENSIALLGKPLKAFPGQAHKAHIDAHRAFMSSMLVKSNLGAMSLLQAHISEHVSFQAREEVMQEMAPQLQQAMQLPPEQQQQLQMQIENKIAERIGVITNNMVVEEQEMMEGMDQDSLVELRKKELDLQAAELRRKEKADDNDVAVDLLKLKQKEKQNKDNLESRQDIAGLRAAVTLSKMNGRSNR